MFRNGSAIKWTVYTVAVFLLSVLQADPFFLPKIWRMGPILLVPAVVCIAMFEGETAGAVYGVIAGLLWDAQCGRLFGFNAFFLLVFGMFAGLLVKYLFRNTVVSVLLLTLSLTLLLEFVTWFFFDNLFGDYDIAYAFLKVMLPTSLYTLIFAFPFYFGAKKLSLRFRAEEDETT